MAVDLPKIQKGVQTPHNVDASRFTSSVQRFVREEILDERDDED